MVFLSCHSHLEALSTTCGVLQIPQFSLDAQCNEIQGQQLPCFQLSART